MENSALITEKRFARSHQSFWHDLLPMMSLYIQRENLTAERFVNPMLDGDPNHRGVINEAGFRVFAAALIANLGVAEVSSDDVAQCIAEAAGFINRFRMHNRQGAQTPGDAERKEVVTLAGRLETFFASEEEEITVWPAFRGCGWLDAAEGDVASAHCLYEVKAGHGSFRGQDVRQILCYAALAHAAGEGVPAMICLVNPRKGVALRDELEGVCAEVAGSGASEVLDSIVSYVSEPQWEERF